MEILQTEIYNHDTDVDVTHKVNSIELGNWINHLNYIKKELNSLIGLCNTDLNQQLEDENLLQKFKKKEIENDTLLTALQKYMNTRSDIMECEDTQCDMAYVKVHESYRKSYRYHLNKYRRLKDNFYSKVQGKRELETV